MAKPVAAHPSGDYTARLNIVIDWISQHLGESISLHTVAAVANFSPFHFHRVFRAHTGETLAAFVTRVRLERAIMLMRTARGKSLTSIALESGFSSSSNFSRVFKARYGVSPAKADFAELGSAREARQTASEDSVATSQVLRPDADVKKTTPSVRVERWAEVRIAYVRVVGGYLKPQSLIDGYHAIEAWAETQQIDRSASKLIGMSIDDPDVVPLAKCRYDFCRTVASKPPPRSGVSYTVLPECDWAVTHCQGAMTDVESTWNFLFREWLPRSGWQPAAIPALEIFNKRPEEIGWDRFDMQCCIPIEALR